MKYPLAIALLMILAQWAFALTEDKGVETWHHDEIPREKIYIQINQPFYAKGDTVWFRCNLVDGATNIPSTSPLYPKDRSKFVYVELHDCKADTLMRRYKIKADSMGVFANAIPLEYDIKAGYYMLVAYTRWMTNFSERNFAYREFSVVGDTDEEDAKSAERDDRLRVNVCPEGGALLTDRLQTLTFLITDTERYPQSAEVRLIDAETDSIITYGETEIGGYGEVLFTPLKGRRYILEAYTPRGMYGQSEIKDIRETGAILHVKQRKGMVYIGVDCNNCSPEDMELIIVNRGKMSTMQPSKSSIAIESSSLDEGMVTLTLVDKKSRQILSTRKFYNK